MEIPMNILETTVKFAKTFVSSKLVTQIVIILTLAYVAFVMGSCNTKTQFEEFSIEYEQILKDKTRISQQATELEQKAESLAYQADQLQDTISRLKITVSLRNAQRLELQTNMSGLQTKLATATDTAEIVVTQQQIIGNLQGQLTNADSTNTVTQSILVNTEKQVKFFEEAYKLSDQRGDSLQRLINDLPKAPADPNKWILGLPKPSRVQVAIAAAAVGAVGGYKLHQVISNQQ